MLPVSVYWSSTVAETETQVVIDMVEAVPFLELSLKPEAD